MGARIQLDDIFKVMNEKKKKKPCQLRIVYLARMKEILTLTYDVKPLVGKQRQNLLLEHLPYKNKKGVFQTEMKLH